MRPAPRRAEDGAGRLPVTTVTFDATGTLFHAPHMARIYSEVFVRHGLDADPATLAPVLRRVWQELSCLSDASHDRFTSYPGGPRAWWGRFVERVAEHLELAPPSPFAVAELYDRFAQGDAWETYPDTVPALERLRAAGASLAVVSNWDRRLERVIAELGLADLFDAVICSSAVGFEKPDPRIFERALAELEVAHRPQQAVHVGDRPRDDIEGALAVGMQGVLLDRLDRHADPPGARARITSLAELPPQLAVLHPAPPPRA